MGLMKQDHRAGVTMSSREIADLCGKRHDNVLRDIEKMLAEITGLKCEGSKFEGVYTDPTGRSLKEYRLPKDLTVTLITGYRADLHYRVVKRLAGKTHASLAVCGQNSQSGAMQIGPKVGF